MGAGGGGFGVLASGGVGAGVGGGVGVGVGSAGGAASQCQCITAQYITAHDEHSIRILRLFKAQRTNLKGLSKAR